MNILDVYKKYRIPPNLQEHMLRVSCCAYLIADNWMGKKIDTQLLVASCLLHDLGNIVKFKWEHAVTIMGSEVKNIEYWKRVQKEIIDTYGSNEYEVTKKMIDELKLTMNVQEVVSHSLFVEYEKILSCSPETKIFEYCDYRVGPRGVISLDERLGDLYDRYKHHRTIQDESKWNRSVEVAQKLEAYVSSSITISVSEINDKTIAPYMNKLRSYQLI